MALLMGHNSAQFSMTQANGPTMPAVQIHYVGYSASTENFATAKNVVIAVQMGVASASLTTTIEGFYMEKVS
jgi:hypothetical protein